MTDPSLNERLKEIAKENADRIAKTEYYDSGVHVPDGYDAVHFDVPFLLKTIEELRAENERYREALNDILESWEERGDEMWSEPRDIAKEALSTL